MTVQSEIWKFPLDPWTGVTSLHRGAKVLSAGAQGDSIVIWARVDPDAPRVGRDVYAFATGHPLPEWTDNARFVGTVQMNDGLVFHVYDGGDPS